MIIDERHPYMQNALNFMIVIHSIIQTTLGKGVFFDQYSQYGGYALILEPLFKAFPPTVLNISVLFAILNLFVVLAMGFLITRLIRSTILQILTFLAFVYFHYFAFVLWPFEKYFQVYPIRTFFPALAIILFMLNKSSAMRSIWLGLTSGIALIWNVETGLAIVMGFILSILSSMKSLNAVQHIAIYISSTLTGFSIPIIANSILGDYAFKADVYLQGLQTYGATRFMSDLLLDKPWVAALSIVLMR